MDLGDPLPEAGEIDGLVVMGGPMGVHDTSDHPYLSGEQELIAECARRELPILGVCLGAQLLAASLGARVYRGPGPEVGAGTVRLTNDGLCDSALGSPGLAELPVLHWHEDTFDLPPGAVHLAESALYPHQAFRAGRCAYGFQFHVEVDAGLAASMAAHLPGDITLSARDRADIERAGRAVIAGFFDAALTRVAP